MVRSPGEVACLDKLRPRRGGGGRWSGADKSHRLTCPSRSKLAPMTNSGQAGLWLVGPGVEGLLPGGQAPGGPARLTRQTLGPTFGSRGQGRAVVPVVGGGIHHVGTYVMGA